MDAGRAYNTWPLMGGNWVPEEYWKLWESGFGMRNFFENTAAVQVVQGGVQLGFGWEVDWCKRTRGGQVTGLGPMCIQNEYVWPFMCEKGHFGPHPMPDSALLHGKIGAQAAAAPRPAV